MLGYGSAVAENLFFLSRSAATIENNMPVRNAAVTTNVIIKRLYREDKHILRLGLTRHVRGKNADSLSIKTSPSQNPRRSSFNHRGLPVDYLFRVV